MFEFELVSFHLRGFEFAFVLAILRAKYVQFKFLSLHLTVFEFEGLGV